MGTMIGHGMKTKSGLGSEPVADRVVTGIAHLGKRAQVKITGLEDFHSSGLATLILPTVGHGCVSVGFDFHVPDLIVLCC